MCQDIHFIFDPNFNKDSRNGQLVRKFPLTLWTERYAGNT